MPAGASAGGDDESWDVARMSALDIPIIQGLCLTGAARSGRPPTTGVSPLDSATQIAIPEFDGRIITAPFSFKEVDADGLPHYVADPERCARVAGIAVNHARLRSIPNAEKRLALVLSAYPTKHARIGNAVGLDTPVSAIRMLRRLRDEGYDLGVRQRSVVDDPRPASATDTEQGDALIHALIAAGGQDEEWLTHAQLTDAHVRITAEQYADWTRDLPEDLRGRHGRGLGRGAGLALRQRRGRARRSRPCGPATS